MIRPNIKKTVAGSADVITGTMHYNRTVITNSYSMVALIDNIYQANYKVPVRGAVIAGINKEGYVQKACIFVSGTKIAQTC